LHAPEFIHPAVHFPHLVPIVCYALKIAVMLLDRPCGWA